MSDMRERHGYCVAAAVVVPAVVEAVVMVMASQVQVKGSGFP